MQLRVVLRCSGVLASEGESMTEQPPRLPGNFQNAFEVARLKADLKYLTRAGAFPHHPQFAEAPLHRIIRVQDEFFSYCSEARNAFRSGLWALAELNRAVDIAWPAICDSYMARQFAASAEDVARLRVVAWKTVEGDPRWTHHHTELLAIAEAKSVGGEPASNASSAEPERDTKASADSPNNDGHAAKGAEEDARPLTESQRSELFRRAADDLRASLPSLPNPSRAKVELAKMAARKRLMARIKEAQGERHRRIEMQRLLPGSDPAALFQDDLMFAFVDYMIEMTDMEVGEHFENSWDPVKDPKVIDTVFRSWRLSIWPMWQQQAGDFEIGTYVDLTDQLFNGSPVYKGFLEFVANVANRGCDREPSDGGLKSITTGEAGQPTCGLGDGDTGDSDTSDSRTASSCIASSVDVDRTLCAEPTRSAIVDDFLFRCNREPNLDVKLVRKHIWLLAGHAKARQFEYWQSRHEKTTAEDEKNFGRIVGMSSAKFVENLRCKQIIS